VFFIALQIFTDRQRMQASAHPYKSFKTILLFCSIQTFPIHKWYVRYSNVPFIPRPRRHDPTRSMVAAISQEPGLLKNYLF